MLIWSNQLSQPEPLLPSRAVTLSGDLRIGQDRLILIGLALLLAVVLGLVYRYTLFGLATSAVSESRRVAAAARWSPSRIEFVNYLIAGFLSALAAILLAPILTLNGSDPVRRRPPGAGGSPGRAVLVVHHDRRRGSRDRRPPERDLAVPARHRRATWA